MEQWEKVVRDVRYLSGFSVEFFVVILPVYPNLHLIQKCMHCQCHGKFCFEALLFGVYVTVFSVQNVTWILVYHWSVFIDLIPATLRSHGGSNGTKEVWLMGLQWSCDRFTKVTVDFEIPCRKHHLKKWFCMKSKKKKHLWHLCFICLIQIIGMLTVIEHIFGLYLNLLVHTNVYAYVTECWLWVFCKRILDQQITWLLPTCHLLSFECVKINYTEVP